MCVIQMRHLTTIVTNKYTGIVVSISRFTLDLWRHSDIECALSEKNSAEAAKAAATAIIVARAE